ncbi:3-oxoacyl-(acyl-carrier-protein) synthase III [Thermocrinis albus DSM 14484]|uniref:Beta-ketoacyl-[acyl-carrier-protein] synthase III n=1 Tax=Thermocrinis albus (strain DSM 14484 / JCM 11386 / HI 11/12) TaxID=638303 RepID=D3SLA3_THEAH|nr:beta-ketoacyl-ACP synthase III [Thermocrinis albus]ADC89533.1 3-oxoacyl-(acyl-carrier-protein) synthase III [Thermocrinis albus DSM 14484]
MGTTIVGLGFYVPHHVLTNFDLEKMVDTSDQWITTRTGIKERRIARDEDLVDMAQKASVKALQMAGVEPNQLDAILVATITPPLGFPAAACLLQQRIEAQRAYALDISAACSGFLYGLELADALITSGKAKKVLLVGAEKLSQIVDWQDRSTCVLFGDGAGAVVLSQGEGGVLSSTLRSDGNFWEILYAPKCGSIKMKGRELFRLAVRSLEEASLEALEKAGLKPQDIDLFVPHQANVRIIEAVAEKLSIPKEKIYINIDRYGNTSAASIPIALSEAYAEGRLRRGDTVLLAAMGGGLTWGAMVIRF